MSGIYSVGGILWVPQRAGWLYKTQVPVWRRRHSLLCFSDTAEYKWIAGALQDENAQQPQRCWLCSQFSLQYENETLVLVSWDHQRANTVGR